MEQNWIGKGDKVIVYFENIPSIEGQIVGVDDSPDQQAEYSIMDEEGKLHTVKNYTRMSQVVATDIS